MGTRFHEGSIFLLAVEKSYFEILNDGLKRLNARFSTFRDHDGRHDSRSHDLRNLPSDFSIAGFFSLATHSVSHDDLRATLQRNMPAPLPVILLGRLAVDKSFQRQGLGESLLFEAVRIAKLAAETIGVVALVVHPFSEEAADFYKKHGFSVAKSKLPLLFFPLHGKH